MLTPDDVHDVVFARARRRHSGYDEAEVDRFLDRVEAALAGAAELTARDALTVEFSPRMPGKQAYKKTQVDAFLERIALTLLRREALESDEDGRPSPAPQPRQERIVAPPPEPVDPPVSAIEVVSDDSQQAYLDKTEVDAFLDRVEATLRGTDTLSSQDLLNARFNPPQPGVPGYHESSVVAFLLVAANSIKQLTPRLPSIPAPRTPIDRAAGLRSAPAPRTPIDRAFRRRPPRGQAPRLTSEDIGNLVLSSPPPGQCGYDEAAVDHFLDRVEATLRGHDTVTPQDVHSVVFPRLPEFTGGYHANEVDSLLGLIEEHLDPAAHQVPCLH